MPSLKRRPAGRVAGLFASAKASAVKYPVDSLVLNFAGVVGDGHGGAVRPAGVRERAFKRGHQIANMRQVSVVSHEELAHIAAGLHIDAIDPGWLAANVALEGGGAITQFPAGSIIRFLPSQASLYVTGVNTPCTFAAKLIAKAGGYAPEQLKDFVRLATGRRGLVAIVYAQGSVSVGDQVEVIFAHPELPLTK